MGSALSGVGLWVRSANDRRGERNHRALTTQFSSPSTAMFCKARPSAALRRSSRALSTTAKCQEKPIMNRYSRLITQRKDQGASQVCRAYACREYCC